MHRAALRHPGRGQLGLELLVLGLRGNAGSVRFAGITLQNFDDGSAAAQDAISINGALRYLAWGMAHRAFVWLAHARPPTPAALMVGGV